MLHRGSIKSPLITFTVLPVACIQIVISPAQFLWWRRFIHWWVQRNNLPLFLRSNCKIKNPRMGGGWDRVVVNRSHLSNYGWMVQKSGVFIFEIWHDWRTCRATVNGYKSHWIYILWCVLKKKTTHTQTQVLFCGSLLHFGCINTKKIVLTLCKGEQNMFLQTRETTFYL